MDGIPWKPLDLHGLKINVDAVVQLIVDTKVLGVGTIVRFHEGQVIVALSKPVQEYFRSDEMEAKAFFHGLNRAAQLILTINQV
uniref:RNase H type-1 domain-containing protein n=1 Tax=Cannabis sativa TaxID=3483 RepID=A0A803NTZ0_CANSA